MTAQSFTLCGFLPLIVNLLLTNYGLQYIIVNVISHKSGLQRKKNMQKEKINPNLITVTSVGICAALLTICSWISIPALGPFVPFTLQTFAVFLIAGLFPLKTSLCSVVVYIALGAVGVPVFSFVLTRRK